LNTTYDVVENETNGNCADKIDNDCNGYTDSADPGCAKNSMNFSGYLKYSDGSAVSSAQIRVTIKNSSLSFEKSSIDVTDKNGYFFVRLDNLPSFIMNTDFDVSFYVIGEVEAIYECHYSKATGSCS
jgi:hypothetical protein